MSDFKNSESYLQPGDIGRKTGFKVLRTPRKGANGLEDPKDFFLSDDEFESQDISNTSPAKRLSVRHELVKGLQDIPSLDKVTPIKPIKNATRDNGSLERRETSNNVSKMVAEISNSLFGESDEEGIDENDFDKVIKNAERIGTPIKVVRRTLTSIEGSPGVKDMKVGNDSLGDFKRHVSNGSKLTKNIALNKTKDEVTFRPQPIENAKHENQKVQELTSSEDNESNSDTPLVLTLNEDKDVTPPKEASPDLMPKTTTTAVIESKIADVIPVNSEKNDDKITDIESKSNDLNPSTIMHNVEIHENPIITTGESESVSGKINVETETNQSDVTDGSVQVSTASPSPVAQKSPKKLKLPSSDSDSGLDELPSSEDVDDSPLTELKNSPVPEQYSASSVPVKYTKAKQVSKAELLKEFSKKGSVPSTPVKTRTPRKLNIPKNTPTQSKDASKSRKSSVKEMTSQLVTSGSEQGDEESSTDNSSSEVEEAAVVSPTKAIEPSPPVVAKKIVKQPRTKKVTVPASPARRSTRTRVPPLASWKNEKIVYKNEKINGVLVKTVDNVRHVDAVVMSSQAPKPKRNARKSSVIDLSQSPKPTTRKKATNATTEKPKKPVKKPESKQVKPVEKPVSKKTDVPKNRKRVASKQKPSETTKRKKIVNEIVDAVEEGNDDDLESSFRSEDNPKSSWQKREDGALTLSLFEGPGTEKQVERTVAFAPSSYKNVTMIRNEDEYFKVGTLFDQDSEFCGGGIIELPSGAKKAVKSNHDTYFIFYVICGEVEVTLSRNTFLVTEGCSFEIPMGNYYQFINVGHQVSRMMFVQSKYVVIGEHTTAKSASDETLDSDDEDDDDDDEDDDDDN